MAEQVAKIKSENNKIINRIGYRYIYHRLEQMPRFLGGVMSVKEAVRKCKWSEAVTAISMENAMM